MTKQSVTARIDGTRGKKKSWRKWSQKIKKNLKIMWIRNWYAVAGHWKEWVNSVFEAEVRNGIWCLRSGRTDKVTVTR